VKFHHCKINLKLPGTDTEVGFHQDFAYTPHTNDDLVTALVMLDDMTLDNGCLRVIRAHIKDQPTPITRRISFAASSARR
jgi:ectoine hydroxylase-related dioxygenase (phytanoyl-CoA dioxygenase family)